MSDETSRASEEYHDSVPRSPSQFKNVEFLESSLSNPVNILRMKLRDVEELPDGICIRRIVILTETITEDGRGIDVLWSESDQEAPPDVQDSLIAILSKVKSSLLGSG